MAEKMGNGGHSLEKYDTSTGKYIEDGKPNEYYDNPDEKIKEYKIPGIGIQGYDSESIKDILKLSYDKLMDNDKTRLYRYREWANNSNDDYKKYIYDDLKSGKKEAALNIWYNYYKLHTGKYEISFEYFLNTPIKLYRATNINEKESLTNPFFSYAQDKKTAERFLSTVQNSYSNRTGEIEEIEIKPIDTFGMFPSDENEIIIPNPKYENLINEIDDKVNNILEYANSKNVTLPYDREKLLNLYTNDKINGKENKTEEIIKKYIEKRANLKK